MLFFVTSGITNVKIELDKHVYYPDEMVHAICKVDNSQCSMDVDHVNICLRRELECYDN